MPKSKSAVTMRDINTILVGQASWPVVLTKRAGQTGSQRRLKSVPPLAPAWCHATILSNLFQTFVCGAGWHPGWHPAAPIGNRLVVDFSKASVGRLTIGR